MFSTTIYLVIWAFVITAPANHVESHTTRARLSFYHGTRTVFLLRERRGRYDTAGNALRPLPGCGCADKAYMTPPT